MKAVVHIYKTKKPIVVDGMEITADKKVATLDHFDSAQEAECFAACINNFFRNRRGEQVYSAVRTQGD